MSADYTTYLILGVKVNPADYNLDIWDDTLLPYIEGTSESAIRIIQSEDREDIYIGKVIASYSKYDEMKDTYYSYLESIIEDSTVIARFLYDFVGMRETLNKAITLMFFTTVN
jgi:uncharacterized membrane protein